VTVHLFNLLILRVCAIPLAPRKLVRIIGIGLLTGAVVVQLCNTPKHQARSVLAACGFGNSTGLAITLLNVIHSNFPVESDLGRIDPTLFLSVYLLLYPVLQWSIGGWLLAPELNESKETTATTGTVEDAVYFGKLEHNTSITESLRHNVLNNKVNEDYYKQHRHGLASSDEGLYMTEV
jgi:predicted permease